MPILAPSTATIAAIAEVLRKGGIAALPTETVYGLAADAANPQAVLKIYEAKGRPSFNPLITHVPSIATAQALGEFNTVAQRLAHAFWPGPLTLVVPRRGQAATAAFDVVCAGLPGIALRVPAHPLFQEVLAACGRPLAAPSANISGHVSATQPVHVLADFGAVLPILDGGPAEKGLESTVIDCTTDQPTLLRAGALARAELEAVLGQPLALPDALDPMQPKAPGMLLKHYATQAPLRLNATEVKPGEVLLAFGKPLVTGAEQTRAVRNLSPMGEVREAAANIFAMLRELDALNPSAIAVMTIPTQGLGEAIADRLTRAAAGR